MFIICFRFLPLPAGDTCAGLRLNMLFEASSRATPSEDSETIVSPCATGVSTSCARQPLHSSSTETMHKNLMVDCLEKGSQRTSVFVKRSNGNRDDRQVCGSNRNDDRLGPFFDDRPVAQNKLSYRYHQPSVAMLQCKSLPVPYARRVLLLYLQRTRK
jgi:hypothetical protein